jgi:hypothetical protein
MFGFHEGRDLALQHLLGWRLLVELHLKLADVFTI